jgi:hypothetical protein
MSRDRPKKQTAFRLSDECLASLKALRDEGQTWTETVEKAVELYHSVQIARKMWLHAKSNAGYTPGSEETAKDGIYNKPQGTKEAGKQTACLEGEKAQ